MRTIIRRTSAAVILSAAGIATPTVAQVSANTDRPSEPTRTKPAVRNLEEVIVTAQRREELTIDVPMTISAVSGEELSKAGITNVRDLSFAVPSLALREVGPGNQLIVIRGISSFRGTSPLTGVYLDEMPVTGVGNSAGYPDLRTIDLARVEVLKGPQGTLFGEGAAGGVIRFITNDPDLQEYGGGLGTSLYNTSDGGWSEEVEGVINLPVAKDVLGIRIAASYEDVSGWVDQPSIGREDVNDSEVKHVRAKVMYAPVPSLRIKGTAEIHRNEGGGSNIVNQGNPEESNFLQAFDRYTRTDFKDKYDLFNLAASYSFRFAELLSSTSYGELDGTNSFTQLLDTQPVPWLEAVSPDGGRQTSIRSQEFRLTSATAGPFNWTLGAAYKDVESMALARSGLDARLFGGATVLRALGAGQRPTTRSESWAGFADLSYEFFNRVQLGGGVRYFHDERESFDPTLPSVATLSGSFEKTTFRTYAKYQAFENTNFYISVASGFRSGGFNAPGNIVRGAPISYGPEETLFYELGTKIAIPAAALRLDAALYYGEYKDIQEDIITTSPVDGAVLQYTRTSSNKVEVKGIECAVHWAATDRLDLSISGDITDSEVVKIDPAAAAPAFRVGDPMNLVPDYTVSAMANYSFSWSAAIPGSFQLAFNRHGESHAVDRSNRLILETENTSPVVDFLNASLGAEWNGWNVSIFGRNLLDERGFINPSTTGVTAQARPRTIGISAGKKF